MMGSFGNGVGCPEADAMQPRPPVPQDGRRRWVPCRFVSIGIDGMKKKDHVWDRLQRMWVNWGEPFFVRKDGEWERVCYDPMSLTGRCTCVICAPIQPEAGA